MTYAAFSLIVVGAGAAAGIASWIVRRSVPLDALRRHHEVGAAVFLQLGVVFAVLLAFVFNQVWNEYNIAAGAINEECGSLHGAAILADALPPAERASVEQAIRTYITRVIEVEWPGMRRRKQSETTLESFQDLWRLVEDLPEETPRVRSIRETIMPLLAAAHQQRETRLYQMTKGVPVVLWVLLVLFALVLTGFLLAFGVHYVSSQVLFVVIFASAMALALATVKLLDFPFEGAMALSSADFRLTLERIDQLQPARGSAGATPPAPLGATDRTAAGSTAR